MWFDGPITNAVAKAKSEDRLLIVFISGEDDKSRRVTDLWETDEIRQVIVENACVALKLTANSEDAKNFEKIYPVVAVPISFFIKATTGVPLEVLVQYDSLEEFKEKLFKAIDNSGNSASTTGKQPPQSVSTKETASSSDAPSPQQPEDSLDDRVQRAQSLLKERQEQKAREAEEKARESEVKRRQEGQSFQQIQQRMKEQQDLQNAYDQKKAKKDDKEHLKKLREQIAADRAEKAAKFNTVQDDQKRAVEEKKQQKVVVDERQRQEEEERRKRFASIQYRLPDGSAPRNQFEGTALFAEAEEWISQQTNTPISNFQLVQMYPRREFTPEDRKRTFAELGLTPTAVLMVLPGAGGSSSNLGPRQGSASQFSWIWGLFMFSVVNPLRFVYNFLYGLVYGQAAAPRPVTAPPPNANNPAQQDQQPGPSGVSGGAGGGKAGSSGSGTGTGKVSSFRNLQDTKKKDDDNATWNGNSTQQL